LLAGLHPTNSKAASSKLGAKNCFISVLSNVGPSPLTLTTPVLFGET
jgi:hypothetical protein